LAHAQPLSTCFPHQITHLVQLDYRRHPFHFPGPLAIDILSPLPSAAHRPLSVLVSLRSQSLLLTLLVPQRTPLSPLLSKTPLSPPLPPLCSPGTLHQPHHNPPMLSQLTGHHIT
jgi:hypothetical protein